MTTPTPSPASAARAVLGGTALGAGVVALVLAQVRVILRDAPASDQPALAGPALPLLLWGTFGAICLACLATALRADPRQTTLRRAAMAMAAGLGTILADAAGLTVYGFKQDTAGTPTCTDGCADAWPPVTVDGETLPGGLDPGVFSVVERSDGTYQLKAGDWPLYRFAGDAAPGDTNGQGSGGVWYVVAPDGTLIE